MAFQPAGPPERPLDFSLLVGQAFSLQAGFSRPSSRSAGILGLGSMMPDGDEAEERRAQARGPLWGRLSSNHMPEITGRTIDSELLAGNSTGLPTRAVVTGARDGPARDRLPLKPALPCQPAACHEWPKPRGRLKGVGALWAQPGLAPPRSWECRG